MKKIVKLIILSLLLIIPLSLKAEVNLKERTESNNYGVNKKWKITESNINNVKNTKYVDSSEKIYDFSNVLTEEEKKELKSLVDDYIGKTKMDMVILIDSVPYTDDYTNETYASDFYDYNDFGIDFKNYSGVILFRNTYETNPYFNVYTFGQAQLYYPQNRCDYVLDDIYEDLKSKNYLDGFTKFIDGFNTYYDKGIPKELDGYYIDDKGYIQKGYKLPLLPAFFIALIVTIIVLGIMIKKNKMVKKETRAGEYLNNGSIKYTKRNKNLISSHTTHYTRVQSSSSGGGGGFSSHSGSSGGGHGGGSGRHG